MRKSKQSSKPLRVILNGLGKDAAKIISRINGFTYVQTDYDYYTGELKEVSRTAYSDGLRSKVNCYGATMFVKALQLCGKRVLMFLL
ncbi:MAG: GGGtGRT protein [Anaerobutyricum sp.]